MAPILSSITTVQKGWEDGDKGMLKLTEIKIIFYVKWMYDNSLFFKMISQSLNEIMGVAT